MRRFYLFWMAVACSTAIYADKPQPTIIYSIYTAEDDADAAFWANVADNPSEAVSKTAVMPSLINGLYNPTDSCLTMHRTASDTWHGIGFDLKPLGKHPSDANHFYLLVKKSAAGPVKLEMQLDNGEGGIVQAWASAEYTNPGQWQALTFPMWEDAAFNANSDKLIKTIYLHTHDVALEEGADVEIWIDQFIAGYDMWNMPVYVNCFEGWNDLSAYPNIHTINAWNNAEVGAGDKEVDVFRYIRTGIADSWTTVGLPFYLPMPNAVQAESDKVYNLYSPSSAPAWTNTFDADLLFHAPYLAYMQHDTIRMEWENITTGYNADIQISDGWQLVANPVMQIFNAGALVNDNTAVYLQNGNAFSRIDNTEHLVMPMQAFLVYRGENAPESVLCGNDSTTAVSLIPSGKEKQVSKILLNGQILILHNNEPFTMTGARF